MLGCIQPSCSRATGILSARADCVVMLQALHDVLGCLDSDDRLSTVHPRRVTPLPEAFGCLDSGCRLSHMQPHAAKQCAPIA